MPKSKRVQEISEAGKRMLEFEEKYKNYLWTKEQGNPHFDKRTMANIQGILWSLGPTVHAHCYLPPYVGGAHLPKPQQGTKEVGRPDFDISHPKDWPAWVRGLHSEGPAVEVEDDGTVIWWGGTVHDGMWCGDDKTYFMGGCFRDGIILGGHFMNCWMVSGEKRGGYFWNGVWEKAIHRAGYFGGLWLGGTWMGGEFNGFRERTRIPPAIGFGENRPLGEIE